MKPVGKNHFKSKPIIWAILVVMVILIKIVSFFPFYVEKYYTYGLYPSISKSLRFLLGWLPFSLGDIFYGTVTLLLVIALIRLFKNISNKRISVLNTRNVLKQILFCCLLIFVLFYGLWGLNYSRVGISGQLQLNETRYSVKDLDTLVNLLHRKLNSSAALLTPNMRDSFKTKKELFNGAIKAYDWVGKGYPFLNYTQRSIKPSIFSYLGNYLGFQGYYNPFSGEAQVNTTIPQSVEPFVTAHEIAHQLGYAKESEANFVGFLACRLHPSTNFKYSVYFDMYYYGNYELSFADSVKAANYDSTLHLQVKKDIAAYRAFYKRFRNPVEPLITWVYSYFLKANNQPKGKESYNEVVTWLIAYYKKYGKEAI